MSSQSLSGLNKVRQTQVRPLFCRDFSHRYPGSQGAYGFADVIFGKVNPVGRATVTYYSSTSDLPTPGEMDEYAGNGVTYRYYKGDGVVFPFGHGLSYTTFAYSNLKLNSSTSIAGCDVVQVTVTVQNTGKLDGDEVVQMYVNQPKATVAVPQSRLADFERVTIAAGASVDVNLVLTPRYHSVMLSFLFFCFPSFLCWFSHGKNTV